MFLSTASRTATSAAFVAAALDLMASTARIASLSRPPSFVAAPSSSSESEPEPSLFAPAPFLLAPPSSSASRRRLCPATTASPPASSKSLRRNGSLTSDVDGIGGGEGSTLDAPVRLAMETMSSWSVFHSVATVLRRDS